MNEINLQPNNAPLLEEILRESDQVFAKKLSNNDRDWSRLPNKHQAGVYVPEKHRDSGFFPGLATKEREGSEIRETFFRTEWPQSGEEKTIRLVHYTSKGAETHLTRLPKEMFRDLSPASFLVIGRIDSGSRMETTYRCVTVDSNSDEIDTLSTFLALDPDEVAVVLRPQEVYERAHEEALSFVDFLLRALNSGTIADFQSTYGLIPSAGQLAQLAQNEYSADTGIMVFDPFALDAPGDAIRLLSRVYEWNIFRKAQLHLRSIQLVRLIVGDDLGERSVETVVRSIVDNYQQIDRILLSASQQRKSRAGTSFELHIEKFLIDGRIPYGRQVVVGSRRPDFILPSLAFFNAKDRAENDAIVLSAKTTLRERWKQVVSEGLNCKLFLATVDETVPASTVEEMDALRITLVVPESLKTSTMTEYGRHSNVIDFKSFFERELRANRWSRWSSIGVV